MTAVTTPQAFDEWAKAHNWPARCDPSLDFESAALKDLLAIWRALGGDTGIPHRNKFSAKILKPYLGNISIMERTCDAVARYRVRLLGTRLSHILGEMQGKYLDEVLNPEVAAHWKARLDVTLGENRPMRFVSRVDARELYFLRSETLWAPLSGDDETTHLVLMVATLTYNSSEKGEEPAALTKFA